MVFPEARRGVVLGDAQSQECICTHEISHTQFHGCTEQRRFVIERLKELAQNVMERLKELAQDTSRRVLLRSGH